MYFFIPVERPATNSYQNDQRGRKKVKEVTLVNLDGETSVSDDPPSFFKSSPTSNMSSTSSDTSSSSSSSCTSSSSSSSSSSSTSSSSFLSTESNRDNEFFTRSPEQKFGGCQKKNSFCSDDSVILKKLKVKKCAVPNYLRNNPDTTYLKKVKKGRTCGPTEYVVLSQNSDNCQQVSHWS
ncbi:unnamed protein product [Rodentolepis nana]|uniref:Vitellogenin-2-like n=1 Tax=Rodentolepis nana TaxID=102285 RepID=A0A0R3TWE1_RODNA|nr:unnamed protein product [Rodentolepis nana]